MGKSGGKFKVQVTEYRMSIHYGVCLGPVDTLWRIFIGEKEAWRGEVTGRATVAISKPELFGGIKKEGGVSGLMEVLPGAPNQVMPEHLAARLGLTSATCPGFRGLFSLFMTGEADEEGFYWTANSPFIRGLWAEPTKILAHENAGAWYPATAAIARIDPAAPLEPPPPPDPEVEARVAGSRASNIMALDAPRRVLWVMALTSPGSGGTLQKIDADTKLLLDSRTVFSTGESVKYAGIHVDDDGFLYVSDGMTGAITQGFYRVHPSTLAVEGHVTNQPWTAVVALGIVDALLIAGSAGGNDGRVTLVTASGMVQRGTALLLSPQCRARGVTIDAFGAGWVLADNGFTPTWAALYELALADEPLQMARIDLTPALGTISAQMEMRYYLLTETVGLDEIVVESALLIRNGATLHKFDLLTRDFVGTPLTLPGNVTLANIGGGFLWAYGTINETLYKIDPLTLTIAATYGMGGYPATGSLNGVVYDAVHHGIWTNRSPTEVLLQFLPDAPVPPLPPLDRPDMNPAHIILECLTNTDWGMSYPLASLDDVSFRGAADTLFDEQFGLSMLWVQQTSIEDFVNDVLGHIQAHLFINPRTGLQTLKLIRDDYDPDALPVLDETNSRVLSFKRKLWGDTVNEIAVSWTNPETNEPVVVTWQDPGNIAIQGAIVSDSRNYHGATSAVLGQRLAVRDLRVASSPLAVAEIEATRAAWDFVPGGVFKMRDPEHGIVEIVMRIGQVDYGKPGESVIKIAAVEDVYAQPLARFVEVPQQSLWQPAGEDPAPIEWTLPFTLPYFFAAAVTDVAAGEYPEVLAGILAAQSGADTAQYELMGPVVDPAGNARLENLGTRPIVARGALAAPWAAAAATDAALADFGAISQGATGPAVGGFLLLGDGAETATELALVAGETAGIFTIRRGVLDTTPKAWPAGTPVWFFAKDTRIHDPERRSAFETLSYKLLARTSRGLLAEAAAPFVPVTLTERPHLPSRPANVTVAAAAFGFVDASALDPIPVAWAPRNRIDEDSQVLAWDDAGVTSEAGQTVTVTVMDLARAVLTVHDALAGAAFDLPLAAFAGRTQGIVRVTAKRDGLESLQGHEIEVLVGPGALELETGGYLQLESGGWVMLEA